MTSTKTKFRESDSGWFYVAKVAGLSRSYSLQEFGPYPSREVAWNTAKDAGHLTTQQAAS